MNTADIKNHTGERYLRKAHEKPGIYNKYRQPGVKDYDIKDEMTFSGNNQEKEVGLQMELKRFALEQKKMIGKRDIPSKSPYNNKFVADLTENMDKILKKIDCINQEMGLGKDEVYYERRLQIAAAALTVAEKAADIPMVELLKSYKNYSHLSTEQRGYMVMAEAMGYKGGENFMSPALGEDIYNPLAIGFSDIYPAGRDKFYEIEKELLNLKCTLNRPSNDEVLAILAYTAIRSGKSAAAISEKYVDLDNKFENLYPGQLDMAFLTLASELSGKSDKYIKTLYREAFPGQGSSTGLFTLAVCLARKKASEK